MFWVEKWAQIQVIGVYVSLGILVVAFSYYLGWVIIHFIRAYIKSKKEKKHG